MSAIAEFIVKELKIFLLPCHILYGVYLRFVLVLGLLDKFWNKEQIR